MHKNYMIMYPNMMTKNRNQSQKNWIQYVEIDPIGRPTTKLIDFPGKFLLAS